MLDAKQLDEIEQRMREEHRLDIEALQRLRRYLPTSSDLRSGAPQSAVHEGLGNGTATVQNSTRRNGLKEEILDIIDSWATTRMTRPKIKEILDSTGFIIQAKDPVPALNQALRKLVADEKIVLLKPGLGSSLAEYGSIKGDWSK